MTHNILCRSGKASAFAGAFCLLFASYAMADDITGQARVIDGDTIKIGKQSIRLSGIDAPELAEQCNEDTTPLPCGKIAALILRHKIADQTVTCTGTTHDRYRRLVATCSAGGDDLGAFMVSEGQALAYRHYSEAYVAEEDEAKAAGRGLWAGTFTPPWTWRKQNR